MKLFCPSCGSPIEFRYDDSFVRVCGACHSAIARTDRGIDTLGQFADLAPASSGLRLGDRGRWQGQPFVLEGRAEYAHPAGGSWEEWYLRLADGRWAWLSHAHGQWALSFPSARERSSMAFDDAVPGSSIELGGQPSVQLTVGERNVAALASAEGELPFTLVPGALVRFLDASDASGRFATVDYGPPGSDEPPVVYLGRRTSLAELGLGTQAAAGSAPASSLADVPEHTGQRLSCPNCNGSIELRVPGRSLSVSCGYCGSLLDCEGPLAILARSGVVDEGHPTLQLGQSGTFAGTRFMLTGRLRKKQVFEGGFIEWDEYLLYAASAGYRWLVNVRGHYSFVTPLPPGAVREEGTYASYGGVEFRLFDRGQSSVTGVWGEFYWKVQLGETAATADFIAPPAMLSRELSDHELHWSLGEYVPIAALRQAFGAASIPADAIGVAPHQPSRYQHGLSVATLLCSLLFLCVLVLLVGADSRQVYVESFQLGPEALAGGPAGSAAASTVPASASGTPAAPYVFFTPPFELAPRQNTRVTLSMPLSNEWAFVTVDLVGEASGQLLSYGAELSYYSGVEGGESWSEGSYEHEHLFGAGPSGSHVLRLEVQTPKPSSRELKVTVAQDVFAAGQLGWTLLLLGLPGGLLALSHYLFERARWADSDFAPGHFRAGGDDE